MSLFHYSLLSILDVFSRFRAFGPLRYARITMDFNTGRSRGTGFVCFWNLEDADKAVEKSEILRLETTGSNDGVSACHQINFDISDTLVAQSKSFQTTITAHTRSFVYSCAEPCSTRSNVGCSTSSHPRQGYKTEGRWRKEAREGGQAEYVPSPRGRYVTCFFLPKDSGLKGIFQ